MMLWRQQPTHGYMSIYGSKMDTFWKYVHGMDIWTEAAPNLQQAVGDLVDECRVTLRKTRSKVIAEYALRDVAKPIGVARCVIQLVDSLPANLKEALPSPEQIAAELKERSQ